MAVILSLAAMNGGWASAYTSYSDVESGAWYYGYVNKISELKGFAGYEDGTFRPENQITQEEFVKTVVCLIDGEQPERVGENTEPKRSWKNCWDSWAQPYLDRAMEIGLITEEDTLFRYNGIACTRGDMAKIITRAVEYLKEEPVADVSTYISKMKDYSSIEEKNREYVLQAYAKGILTGYEDGTFRSNGFLTRAEASSILVRLQDKEERITENEKLYDYYGRQVTWTEKLRTDIPEQYQVSLSDLNFEQAVVDDALANGGNLGKEMLNRSKSMMFEDLVLQSITYEDDTIKLTIPDYLPEIQRWSISISYWDVTTGYDFTTIKSVTILEPGEYIFPDVKVLNGITICVLPANTNTCISQINITNGTGTLERLEQPEVSFNNIHRKSFVWVQGQGYKDYIKDYTLKIDFELNW